MTEPASLHDAEQTLEAARPKRYAAYPAYRPSGIEWLGDVPEHWKVKRLKYVLERNDSGVWGDQDDPKGTVVLRSTEQTVDGGWRIDEPSRRALSEKERKYAMLKSGDLLVTKSSGSSLHIGKTSLVSPEVAKLEPCFSNFMQRLRTRQALDPRWAYYLLNCPTGRQQMVYGSNTTTGLANLNGTILGNIWCSFPEGSEQEKVLAFVDEQTKKIDDLIEAKRDLLGLVEEKKQSVISHAVIEGLRPNVPLKESPQHWLGDIPVHWNYMPIKWIVETPVTDGPHETPEWVDQGVPFVSAEGVFDGRVHLNRCRGMITPEQHREYSRKACPKRDDIFIVKSGATTGKVGYVDFDDEFNIWSPLALIRCDQRLALPRYVYYAFVEASFQRQVQLFWSYGTQPNIGMGDLQNLVIAIPPLDEQREIIDHLESEVGRLNALAVEAATAIESLGELRTGMISAAVTGKIDVRGGAA